MVINPKNCLFDLWQATSAPMFHTSEFWPAFNEASIQEFLTGTAPPPTPSRPANLEAARAARQAIEAFVAQAEALSPTDYPCQPAYIAFDRERLATLDLILHADNPAAVNRANDSLFGSLQELHQAAAVEQLKHHLEQLEPAGTSVSDRRAKLLEVWREVPARPALAPTLAAIDRRRLQLRPLIARQFAFVEPLMAPYAGRPDLTSQEVVDVLKSSIAHLLGNAGGGWTARPRDSAPNAFIDSDARAVIIPTNRRYTQSHVRALIIHEVGVHVLRSLAGSRSHEPLAALGLPGYGATEEAFGVLLEHAPEEHYDPIHSLLPLGLIDLAGRLPEPNFRRLHELATALIICDANPNDAALAAKPGHFARAAFSRILRISRFGTGAVIDRSTTKYWHGLLLLLKYFDSHEPNAATLQEFMLGKYDCLNPAQLALIQTHHTQGART
jgi:hypothetical protein